MTVTLSVHTKVQTTKVTTFIGMASNGSNWTRVVEADFLQRIYRRFSLNPFCIFFIISVHSTYTMTWIITVIITLIYDHLPQ